MGRIEVQVDSWLAHRTIRELELSKEGVLVLSLEVTGEVMECALHSQHEIRPGDALILCGEQRWVLEGPIAAFAVAAGGHDVTIPDPKPA